MPRVAEQELTPENYARLLKEAQDKLGTDAGADFLHHNAVNQGFRADGSAIVTGIKWVKGHIESDGVLVEGLNAQDPFQLTMFKH